MYYEYSDKVMKTLRRRYIDIFLAAKSELPIDELNIIKYVQRMYGELTEVTEAYMLKVAKKSYKDITGKDDIVEEWLEQELSKLSPITGYKFYNEIDRKKSRFAEAVASGMDDSYKTALNLWSRMVNQKMIEIVDQAVLDGLIELGYKKVMWHTSADEKVCDECEPLDKQVFKIDEVPTKPHINCRCYLTGVK